MNRLGMMIDVSHASDKAFYDVMELSKAPVIASHSSVKAIAQHNRNMTDDMIRNLPGVVAHTVDTASLLANAIHDVNESFLQIL